MLPKTYIIKSGEDQPYVVVTQGQTGYGILDDEVQYDKKFADDYNKRQGHTEKDLMYATLASMFGNW